MNSNFNKKKISFSSHNTLNSNVNSGIGSTSFENKSNLFMTHQKKKVLPTSGLGRGRSLAARSRDETDSFYYNYARDRQFLPNGAENIQAPISQQMDQVFGDVYSNVTYKNPFKYDPSRLKAESADRDFDGTLFSDSIYHNNEREEESERMRKENEKKKQEEEKESQECLLTKWAFNASTEEAAFGNYDEEFPPLK